MPFAPVDLIIVSHNAFRRDLADIDAAVLSSVKQDDELTDSLERLEFFTTMLSWHALGEDSGIFPALELVAPDVAASYEIDHRGLDLASEGLDRAIEAGDRVGVTRATAAFKFHLDMHLHKEEVHLYRLFADRLSESEQAEAVGIFTEALPRSRFADFVKWLFPLVDIEDQARVVRVWEVAMPSQVFTGVMGLVQGLLGNDYAALAQLVPRLGSS